MIKPDDIRTVLNFQKELKDRIISDTCYYDFRSAHVADIRKDPDISAEIFSELLSRKQTFLGSGAYSIAYLTTDNTVLTLTDCNDQSKDLLYEITCDNPHLPDIEYIDECGDFTLYELPFYNVLSYKQMSPDQQDIYDILTVYYKLSDIIYDLEGLPFSDSLKEAFNIVYDFWGDYTIDLKDENIAFNDDGEIVLLDLFHRSI